MEEREDQDHQIDNPTQSTRSSYWQWFFLGGTAVFLLWAFFTHWLPPVIQPDINQHRRNTILPPPAETSQIRQTFIPIHNGLSEVEIKLARQQEIDLPARLELQLLDQNGETITTQSLDTADLAHEQNYVLRFDPRPDSAEQTYTLLVSGSASNTFSLWGYDLDVHSGGQLTTVGTTTAARDLYLITRYRLTTAVALQALWQSLKTYGPILLLSLAYILLPGTLLLTILDRKRPSLIKDPVARLGLALALGLALWPLLWQWLTLLTIHWNPTALWLTLITGWLTVIILKIIKHPNPRSLISSPQLRITNYQLRITHYALLLLLLTALSARLLAVRDQPFPLWVDSSRHALITAVMTDTGQVIQDYQPFLDIDRFPYHYGFHTIAAGVSQMSGRSLPELLLGLSQLLNALVPLTIYAATCIISRRRTAGLIAAFLVALPFFFPAYYVTWGRMTQLTGVLLLPILLAVTWQTIRGSIHWRGRWWLVGILAAGLFLIHFRVFLLYVPFAGMVWLFSLGRNGRRFLLSAALALALIIPRLLNLLADTNPARAVSNSIEGYNNLPTGYVTAGWEQPFLWMGAGAVLLSIVAAVLRRRWGYAPLFLVIWAGLTAVLLSGRRLGLPETSLINAPSAYIVLFVPLSMILGFVAERLWHWLMGRHWFIQSVSALLVGAGVAAAAVFGFHQQVNIINPETILAQPPDEAGLDWVAENAPDDARFVVNAFHWLGTTWAARDGGAWIVPLTGRSSTTPPADYIYSPDLAVSVDAFNSQMLTWGTWADPLIADQLRQEGVTHVFIGARGGTIDPAELARNPEMDLLFGQNGVFIFALK